MQILEETKELVKSIQGNIEQLVSFGFKKVKPTGCSTGFIMINEEKGVVVKRPYTLCREKPSQAVETEVLHFPISVEEKNKMGCYWPMESTFNDIFIQPLVDVSVEARKKALEEISKQRLPMNVDEHEGNVGIFQGKSVMIDW